MLNMLTPVEPVFLGTRITVDSLKLVHLFVTELYLNFALGCEPRREVFKSEDGQRRDRRFNSIQPN